jgi:hypothetical protein
MGRVISNRERVQSAMRANSSKADRGGLVEEAWRGAMMARTLMLAKMARSTLGRWLLVSSILAFACTAPQPHDMRALVDAKIVGGSRGRPPRLHYELTLTLRNPSAEPRWLLWPQQVSPRDELASRQLIQLSLIELSSEPPVAVVSGFGANFWAARLPGHGRLTLDSTSLVGLFNTPEPVPETVDLDVIVATEIYVDGVPIERVLGVPFINPMSASLRGPQGPFDPSISPVWEPDRGMGFVSVAIESTETRVLRLPPI